MRLPDEYAEIWLRGERPFPGDRPFHTDPTTPTVTFRPDLLEALEALHDHDDDQLDPEHYE